jgi:Mrp family chromosome partitioning ATPase
MTSAAGERLIRQLDRLAAPTRRPHVPAAAPIRGGAHGAEIAEQLVSLLATESYEADQYRTLRHGVEWLRKESDLQVLAVTSPSPGDGKTITTLNLAGALAQGPNARVLVVDADLRRPSVTGYLGLGRLQGPGLADALADPLCDVRRVIRRLDGFSLSVLPPLVPLPDCRLIGNSVDGFLVVVGAHKTRRRILADALQSLGPGKVIGVVFNGDDRPTAGYYGCSDYYRGPRDRQRGRWREWLSSATVLRPRPRE